MVGIVGLLGIVRWCAHFLAHFGNVFVGPFVGHAPEGGMMIDHCLRLVHLARQFAPTFGKRCVIPLVSSTFCVHPVDDFFCLS